MNQKIQNVQENYYKIHNLKFVDYKIKISVYLISFQNNKKW